MREDYALSLSKGWKVVKLKDITKVITKGTTPSTYGYDFLENGEVNYIRAEGISKSGYVDQKTFLKINTECHDRLKRSKLEENDVLFSIAGMALGKSGIVKKEYLPANTNQAVAIVRPNNLVFPKFLLYYIANPSFYQLVNSVSGQAAQPNINLNQVGSLPINLPPLETQRKIAFILSGYDDLIENNLKRIKILEEMAQQTYEEWFVRMRFPGYETAKIDEVTGLPEGWENGTLENITKYLSGFAFKSAQFKDNGNGVIRIKNIGNNTINLSDVAYVDNEYASKQKRYLLKSGDLLIAMTGATIGKVGIMPHSNERFYLNQRVGKFVTENTAFLNCFFNSTYGSNQINNIAGGAAQPNISAQQILDIELNIPSKGILNKFSDKFNRGISMIINLQSQNQRLRESRDILLPRLMMGIVEV